MLYRIIRKEGLTPRPKWVLHLFYSIDPAVYFADSKESLQDNLSSIYGHINSSPIWKSKGKFKLQKDDNNVSIVNNKGRVYLSFCGECM